MFEDIVATSAAYDRTLRPDVLETPLEARPAFSNGATRVFAKLENRQITGSFKFRGATAKLRSLAPRQLTAGVVTASTGNHGAAVAQAAVAAGSPAAVYVSTEADAQKVAAIRRLGGIIREVPGDPVAAELAARSAARTSGRQYVSPYNDATVVAGQGMIGVELLRQLPDVAAVVVSVGGGGLIAGIAATLRAHRPDVQIIAASAANTAAMHHSVAAGSLIDVDHSPTLSDGTAGGIEPEAITFDMCRRLVDKWVLVNEDEIARAMRRYIQEYGERIEGSAGLALAAVSQAPPRGPTAVIICGGNVSDATLSSIGIDA